MEFSKFFILLFIILNISFIIDMGICLWQSTPLEEEKSTPVYIVKEIKED